MNQYYNPVSTSFVNSYQKFIMGHNNEGYFEPITMLKSRYNNYKFLSHKK